MDNRIEQIRRFVQDRIRKVGLSSNQPVAELGDDLNLVETGLFDSLDFVQLISAIEKEFHIEMSRQDLRRPRKRQKANNANHGGGRRTSFH